MSDERELLRELQARLEAADVDVASLVEGAWEDAREDVRATLRRLMTRDLLERALRTLDGTGAPAPARTGRAEPSHPDPGPTSSATSGAATVPPSPATEPQVEPPTAETPRTTTYLFGIVAAGTELPPLDPPLPGGGPLRLLELDGFAALVSDVDPTVLEALQEPGPDGLEVLAAAAQAHDDTLARFVHAPILPLRLGTVLADDAAVRSLLAPHATQLRAELARIAGHAEWAVTVRATRPGSTGAQAPSEPTSGRAYLEGRREALRARDERWRDEQELADAIHGPLAAVARDAHQVASRPLEETPPLLHGVYLVEDHARERLASTVAYLREEHRDVAIEVTGPWPPYHFTALDLSTHRAADQEVSS